MIRSANANLDIRPNPTSNANPLRASDMLSVYDSSVLTEYQIRMDGRLGGIDDWQSCVTGNKPRRGRLGGIDEWRSCMTGKRLVWGGLSETGHDTQRLWPPAAGPFALMLAKRPESWPGCTRGGLSTTQATRTS